MKCINKNMKTDKTYRKKYDNRKRRGRQRRRAVVCSIFGLLAAFALGILAYLLCSPGTSYVTLFETEKYRYDLHKEEMFAQNLCVPVSDVETQENSSETTPAGLDTEYFTAAALFDLENSHTIYERGILDTLYPASTTKLMTAYLTLKYGNLDDVVTVSETATTFEPDAQLCGLAPGDTLTLYELLCGLILYSGNDNAAVIAEHISGSVEQFAELMNAEAHRLGATHSHFMNPHGLHEENHYTTAYDLYLIFNACLKDSRFMDIISMKAYDATITDAAGNISYMYWPATNWYSSDIVTAPEGIHVFGGKTGTTDEAGNCVILYSQDTAGKPYISVTMGAESKDNLYDTMNILLKLPFQ